MPQTPTAKEINMIEETQGDGFEDLGNGKVRIYSKVAPPLEMDRAIAEQMGLITPEGKPGDPLVLNPFTEPALQTRKGMTITKEGLTEMVSRATSRNMEWLEVLHKQKEKDYAFYVCECKFENDPRKHRYSISLHPGLNPGETESTLKSLGHEEDFKHMEGEPPIR
jgi:hypothetical protein